MKMRSDALLAMIRDGKPMTLSQQLRLTVQLSVPAIIAQLSSIVMQYIDAAMVGSLGAEESAAIGLVSTTTWLFWGLCVAAATGFSVQVAHRIGAGDMRGARVILRQSVTATLCFSLLLASIGATISSALPEWLGGDVSIRPGWFYHPEEDDRVKTVDELTDLYYRSVGHNATLLLNFPVDRDGLIHPTDSANAVNFHQNVQKQLAHNLLAGLSPKASDERGRTFSAKAVTDGAYDTYWATNDDVISATIEFDLPQAEKINRMMLQEYIPLGQRVKSFVVEYNQAGEWIPVKLNEETTTIGYKRLLRFETITTDKIRVRFTDSRACLCINNIEAYYAGETSDTYTAKAAELKSYPFTLVGVDVEEAQKGMDKNDQTTCFINGNTLLIDLGEERTITSFHYLPEQSEYNKGLIAAYEISVGMDSNAVNQVVAKDEFSNIKSNPILQSVYFTPVKARYIQLKATRMIHDGEPMGLAEIGIQ